VLSTIERRFPLQEVILYPSLVQGAQAAENLRRQLAVANERNEVDVLLVVRGGGAIEDLWSFNDEQLARDIFHSEIPVVSGVGHEVDVTIVDFVADLRAATPTAAAEHTTPDQVTLLKNIQANRDWLMNVMKDKLQRYAQQVDTLQKQLTNPDQLILRRLQQLENLKNILFHNATKSISREHNKLQAVRLKLLAHEPLKRIQLTQQNAKQYQAKLQYLIKQQLERAANALARRAVSLDNLSPLKVLGRGYSVTMNDQGKAILSTTDVIIGEQITSRLNEGKIISKVTAIKVDQSGK
jgi:exodeoxyribonuclease VII large subunit